MRPVLVLALLGGAAGCLPAETDEVWQPGDDSDVDTTPDTDPVTETDTDGPSCDGSTPPPALPPTAPSDDGWFTLQELGRAETTCLVVEDLDRDGKADLVLLNQDGDRLGIELRQGTGRRTLGTWTGSVSLPSDVRAGGCTVDDVDGDHDLDVLYLTSTDVRALLWDDDALTDGGVVGELPASVSATGFRQPELIVPIDLDHQGRLDLVVGHHALLSDTCPDPEQVDTGDVTVPAPEMDPGTVTCLVAHADGTYAAADGLCPSPMLTVPTVAPYGAEVGDFDDDGDDDLLLVADFSKNRMLDGTPTGLVPHEHSGLEVYNHAMGVASDDFDGDGQRDFFVSDLGPTSVYFGQCGAWFDGSRAVGLWKTTHQTVTWGAQAVDLDFNGASDLVVGVSVDAAGSQDPASMCIGPDGASTAHPPTMLLMNPGDARFVRYGLVDTTTPPEHASGVAVRVATGDLDGDLDPDVVVSTGQGTSILWNDLPKQSDGLRIHPVDAHGLPALGARVTVVQGTYRRTRELRRSGGYASTSEGVVTFALAGAGQPRIRVRWPDGVVTTHGPFQVGTQDVTIGEEP
jgi:hypothetical protein